MAVVPALGHETTPQVCLVRLLVHRPPPPALEPIADFSPLGGSWNGSSFGTSSLGSGPQKLFSEMLYRPLPSLLSNPLSTARTGVSPSLGGLAVAQASSHCHSHEAARL